MKLMRVGAPGRETPAILADDGTVRDLSRHVDDLAGAGLDPEALANLAGIDLSALPRIADGTRIGPCVGRIGNFIGVGLNYADHAVESGMPIPVEPILFNKAPSSLCGPDDDVPIPPGSTKLDWEVELAVVIGRRAWQIAEAEVGAHIAGYCICNDVSERAWQIEGTGQWSKGKSAPGFGPLGPWLVTRDEILDPMALSMSLDIDGERMQSGSTATMIFSPAFLVAYISRFMALEPGDVITTGTPPGVGMGRKPPRFLKAGEVMTLQIEGLGRQRQRVVEGA